MATKVLVASAPWKGSHSAVEVTAAIAGGVRAVWPEAEVVECPVADGGEGTLDVLRAAWGGEVVEVEATDLLGRPVRAPILLLADTGKAVVESATVCGLPLLGEGERDPSRSSTQGLRGLVAEAAQRGASEVITAVGGTGTVDGGTGMLRALGARLLDDRGGEITSANPLLSRVAEVDLSGLDASVLSASHVVLADVTAPFTGPNGAARAFGPQKGATPAQVEELEACMELWADALAEATGRDPREAGHGAGAGGGIPGAMWSALDASIESGALTVMRASGLLLEVTSAKLVFTGEGRYDATTLQEKAPWGVSQMAKRSRGDCVWITAQPSEPPPPGAFRALAAAAEGEPATLAEAARLAGEAALEWRRGYEGA
ncbi:MAG: glycerate kinase family protein [Planctomycetota bacterium]|jgi:glycerate kinase